MAYGTMNTRTVRDRLEILVQSVTTGSVVTAYGLDEVTEFGYISSQSVGFVPGEE
jgi:hypothetical protein